jgi:hypothetical protein
LGGKTDPTKAAQKNVSSWGFATKSAELGIVNEKEAVMIHIGTVHLNGREYSLDLNRPAEEKNDSHTEPSETPARRNLPTNRSEIFLLNPNRKPAGHHGARMPRTVRSIDDVRRLAEARHQEEARAQASPPKSNIDSDGAVKFVSRLLSWWFPVREFKSPLQRVLYLSIEKPEPKAKHRSRYLLP